MTTASAAVFRCYRPSSALRRRPQLVAEIVVAMAWVAMLELHAGPPHHAAVGSFHSYLHGPPATLAGVPSPVVALIAGLTGWLVMSAAMMVPIAIPTARRVGSNTVRWDRHRAVAEFLGVCLSVWIAYGALVLMMLRWWHPGSHALPAVLAVAAAWQFTPWHRRFVGDCHRTLPLPPAGPAAFRAARRYGLQYGRACLGASWALMLVMAVVRNGQVAWAIGLGAAMAGQELLVRPGRTTRVVAVLLVFAAATAVLSA